MKDTLENKIKFFAQYYGQNIKRSHLPDQSGLEDLNYQIFRIPHLIENGFLELKPLSSLTDEDATWIADLRYGERLIDMVKYGIEHIAKETIYADYLRSKGYAVNWLDISVDEMIEFGWIKLKES